ncbi:FadR/GntR family transcriptional regulator [Desulfoplanes formicivorans]|uniref:GntR family transcriptional regulator n=1 Tax=Desulfoplanes formicivorans TaxID=1592317 RepID=A0A194AHU4_9BACT|nr:FadR/GntR family transcriptional regulator [Desulfoplanes formicivorans]GAU08344.1 GntR family transcriptional regulator [Desulfoplanes formicivorans]
MTHPETSARPPKKLYIEIVHRIRTLIQEDEFGPGSRLPAERKLAQQFGVSRNSVREAIKQLEEAGILESRMGAGTYVAAKNKKTLVRALARELERGKARIREIFEIRTMLEPQIAGLAATRISTTHLNNLHKIITRQEQAVGNIKTFTALDARFHRLLVQAAGNEVLEQVMVTLRSILRESRSAPLMTTARQHASIKGHRAIVEALSNRDAQGAIRAMNEHIRDIEQPDPTPD